jgi:pimeloyl-ACP methyl ester carboxylesterase
MSVVEPVSRSVAPRRWRRVRRWLGVAVLGYLGVLIVLLALERLFIFVPSTAAESWHDKPDPRIEDVTLHAATGEQIHAWWLPQPGATGVLHYSHGNAGNLSHRGPGLLRWASELNVSVLIYDYPGYGRSPGRADEQNCYATAEAAYQWLTDVQKIEPRRVLLLGASLGASMAVEMASRHDHRALILIKPFSSIPDMAQARFPWLPARYFVRHKFDNVAKIHDCHRPVFVVHGTSDTVIPYKLGKRVFDAANEPKEFVTLDGHDHNTSLPGDFFQQLRSFLEKHTAN